MTFGIKLIRLAQLQDIDNVKTLADSHKHELGFIRRGALEASIPRDELLVVYVDETLGGFVHYRHRLDGQTTLYHIAVVQAHRHQGLGKSLLDALVVNCRSQGQTSILLKCPEGLPANQFYEASGFSHVNTESGKDRALRVWQLKIPEVDRI